MFIFPWKAGLELKNSFTAAVHKLFVPEEKYGPGYRVSRGRKEAITEFFDSLRDMTIEDSFTEHGIAKVHKNFRKFLVSQKCWTALYHFGELRQEKSGKFYYRADKKTPSTLHEIRNCAQQLGHILKGYIPPKEYEKSQGIDADMSGRLRHDSIEDHGISRATIFALAEEYLHEFASRYEMSQEELKYRRHVANVGAEVSDLMTRKDAKKDENGIIVRTENGKIIKEERFNGDTGIYFQKLNEHIDAILGKYSDRIENVTTRSGVDAFGLDDNRRYARETREIYGLEAFDDLASKKWPAFEAAIRSSDAMLGLNLLILEGVNKYKSNPALGPENANLFRLERYLPDALIPYQDLPAIFHPISIHLHMLEREIKHDPRIRTIIDDLILPPLQDAVDKYGLKPIPGVPPRNQAVSLNREQGSLVSRGSLWSHRAQ